MHSSVKSKRVQFGKSHHTDCHKDLIDRSHNTSHLTLYPDVLKIKNNNGCETNISKNATCLLLITNLQIHNLATLLPERPSCRVVSNGFVNL